jgi:nucleoid DNA-binding protein
MEAKMKAPIRPLPPISRQKALTGQEKIEQLAKMSGATTAFMRKFVREAIAVIEAGLLRDGVVKIHEFGTFRLNAAATKLKPTTAQVIFQPSKNMRELIIRAFGPMAQTGSRISLPALLEKHLEIFSPPPAVAHTEPPSEEFDITEVFPELLDEPAPRLTLAEAFAEEALRESEAETLIANPRPGVPTNGKPLNGAPPTLSFDETAEEAEFVRADADSALDRLLKNPVPPRRRRFVWYVGAFAIFLLLLLFVMPGRISEKQESALRPVADTTAMQTNHFSARNESSKPTTDQPPVAPAPAPFFAGGVHRVALRDNLWRLSGNYYRNHYLWPNIYRANTATIKNPDVLELDQQLALPVLYGAPERLTAEDHRNLAEGYFLLYRFYKAHAPALAPFALWAAVRYNARLKQDFAAELSEDDWAFLEAHAVSRQVAER